MVRNFTAILIMIGLAILTIALVTSAVAMGENLIEEDDFTGADGSSPDTTKWIVTTQPPDSSCVINNNNVKFEATNNKWPSIRSKDTFETKEFRMDLEWSPMTTSRGPLSIVVKAYNGGTSDDRRIYVAYDQSWGFHLAVWRSGSRQFIQSNDPFVTVGRWYSINLTVFDTTFNVTIKDMTSGSTVYDKKNIVTDPFTTEHEVSMGVGMSRARFDNYKLYNLGKPPNQPPEWRPVPTLTAVEDVPIMYNFATHVSDPDGPLDLLTITSASPYVIDYNGLNVTFLFPNGVLNTTVPLVLRDLYAPAVYDVNFTITPVNDPPSHTIPPTDIATEDVPLTVDLSLSIWDVDNRTEDLFLIVDDPYATTDGLNLTVLFPEGISSHYIYLNISDGLLTTEANIHFGVRTVDDPPEVGALPRFNATEEHLSVFNLTPYLSDVDTPVEDLSVLAREPNCTVVGRELHFLFPIGDTTHYVDLEIADASNRIVTILVVYVEDVNDAPVVAGISPKLFTEDEAKTVELAVYISDEDSAPKDFSLACDHQAVINIEGTNITFLYETWQPEHIVTFRVFDGIAWANGSFEAQVRAVNDPPTILGLGALEPPIVIVLDEGTDRWFEVMVADEDSTEFDYGIESEWEGVMVFSNGSLRVTAGNAEVGDYTVTLSIDDRAGGADQIEFIVQVKNVNDPPSVPIISKPLNHTIVEEGENVTFGVDVSDPDIQYDQVLVVTWVSNISGVIRTLTTEVALEFVTNELPVGDHRITVTANDGEHMASVWFDLTVIEKYVPPKPKPDEPNFFTEPAGIATILIMAVLVIIAVAWLVAKSRKREEEPVYAPPPQAMPMTVEVEPRPEVPTEPSPPTVPQGPQPAVTGPEVEREAEAARASPLHPPPPELETVRVPEIAVEEEVSVEELADRAHAAQVREVMKVLTQLPRGRSSPSCRGACRPTSGARTSPSWDGT
jgi:hypothetical protein